MNYAKKLRVDPGTKIDLDSVDADVKPEGMDREEAEAKFRVLIDELRDLQHVMYAENRRSLLIILQGRDAAGKDGTIRHVFGPMNPQGTRVTAFKVPTREELAHDFLWRCHKAVPEKGTVGIFNRSHYEDVLVVRVHNPVPKEI